VDTEKPVLSASTLRDFGKWLALHNPASFGRLAIDFLCTLAEVDHDAGGYILGLIISRELGASGLSIAVDEAERALASWDVDRAKERLESIKAWLRVIESATSPEKLELLEMKAAESRLLNMASPSTFAM
jgi:hypothetical protein